MRGGILFDFWYHLFKGPGGGGPDPVFGCSREPTLLPIEVSSFIIFSSVSSKKWFWPKLVWGAILGDHLCELLSFIVLWDCRLLLFLRVRLW